MSAAKAATWGIVTTVKAPMRDVLNFVAWHVELGAHRIYVHLDSPDPECQAALKAHPKVRVTQTGAGYWDKQGGKAPAKHQVRQTRNATRILARTAEVDWLAHIDVDEFIIADAPVGETLAALADATQVARLRPVEALAPPPNSPAGPEWMCKAMSVERPKRRAQTDRIYGAYARGLDGGFLSHVAGKIFVSTSLAGAEFRIHNVIVDGVQNPNHAELGGLALCHMHAPDAETWLAHYRFRHDRGSYRSELKPPRPSEDGGMTLHQMLSAIEADDGEDGLRAFFQSACTATPDLCAALRAEGLLRRVILDLDAARAGQFPGY